MDFFDVLKIENLFFGFLFGGKFLIELVSGIKGGTLSTTNLYIASINWTCYFIMN